MCEGREEGKEGEGGREGREGGKEEGRGMERRRDSWELRRAEEGDDNEGRDEGMWRKEEREGRSM